MNFDGRRYRPMGTADLFDEAFDLYKKNFILFLGVAALVYVPLRTFLTVYTYSTEQSLTAEFVQAMASMDLPRAWQVTWEYLLKSYTTLPIDFVAYSLMTGALTSVVSARYLHQPATLFGAYRVAISRWFALFTSLLLYDALVAICVQLCVFPVVFPVVLFLFTPQAAIVEGRAGFRALARARRLLSGFAWRVFGSLILLVVLYWAISAAVEAPLSLFADKLVTSSLPFLPALAMHQQLSDQIADELTGLLVLPFVAAVITLLYYDLRIRKEGFDMDVLAESLNYPQVDLAGVRPYGSPPVPAPLAQARQPGRRGRR